MPKNTCNRVTPARLKLKPKLLNRICVLVFLGYRRDLLLHYRVVVHVLRLALVMCKNFSRDSYNLPQGWYSIKCVKASFNKHLSVMTCTYFLDSQIKCETVHPSGQNNGPSWFSINNNTPPAPIIILYSNCVIMQLKTARFKKNNYYSFTAAIHLINIW